MLILTLKDPTMLLPSNAIYHYSMTKLYFISSALIVYLFLFELHDKIWLF